jgi:hypothetical protein
MAGHDHAPGCPVERLERLIQDAAERGATTVLAAMALEGQVPTAAVRHGISVGAKCDAMEMAQVLHMLGALDVDRALDGT